MTRRTNARIAGFTFLLYISAGIVGNVLFGRATSGEGIAAKLAGIAQAGYEKSQEYSSPRVADQFLKDFESILERAS